VVVTSPAGSVTVTDVGSAPVGGVYAVVVVRLSASAEVSTRPYSS
jgi:hypothetical protein